MKTTSFALVALALALVAVPAIVLAGGSSTGSGAATSAATVDVADQSVVSLSPASGSNGQYAEITANGELALQFDDLNRDAETTANRVFTIEATDSGPTRVWVESGPPGVSFYWAADPSENASEPRHVQPGATVTVGVQVDSYDGVGSGNFTVVAEQQDAAVNDGDVVARDANVSPTNITVGGSVTATATLRNHGADRTLHHVELLVDGTVVDQKALSVPGDGERIAIFQRGFQQPGEYDIEVAELEAGTVTVRPNETEADGGFVVSNASLSPATIQPGETTTISADVTNRGDAAEVFTAEFAIGGAVVEKQAVEVPVGETATVTFERSFERRGSYEIAISGAEAGTLRVESSTATSVRRYGSEYGWFLGAVTVPALGGAFVAVRRRQRLVIGDR